MSRRKATHGKMAGNILRLGVAAHREQNNGHAMLGHRLCADACGRRADRDIESAVRTGGDFVLRGLSWLMLCAGVVAVH